MRVLMIRPGPHFSVADVYQGWYRAFLELGCTVVDCNLDERLEFYAMAGRMTPDGQLVRMVPDEIAAVRLAAKGVEAVCYEFWPDVIVIVSGFYLPLDTLDVMRSRGHHVVILHTESPYEDERQLTRAEHATCNVLNDPTNIDRFRALGPRAIYLPHAYDPAVHHPGPARPEMASDFCFVGTGYPSRIGFLEQVDWTGIDVALAGHWKGLDEGSPLRKFVAHDIEDCCDNADTVDMYRSARASVNLYRQEAERADLAAGWAMGPREVELAATGCFYLTEERGENREVLPMVPTFDGPGDFEEQLRWHLAHPDDSAGIAAAARAAVADRTFVNNARALLAALS